MVNDRVLVIDDCRITVLLLKHILGKIKVCVDSAGCGEAGIELASKSEYALIFVDILMPGIDGLETCRRIREQSHGTRPRLILLTAMGEQLSPIATEAVGADGLFFKPIMPSRIIETVRETLEAARQAQA